MRNDNGSVDICVFDGDQGFPDCTGHPAGAAQRRPAARGAIDFAFDVAPGPHAVAVLHDENNNGLMDTNFLGIPREGGGVSNNPRPRLGPPRYRDAVFTVPPAGAQIVVAMVYP